jgi:poly(hydroxyalkanoate) depolymerase family esterase
MVKMALCVLMLLLTCVPTVLFAQTGSIKVGSTTRTFIVYAPDGLPEHPALVVSMHGLGGSGSQQRSMSGFDKVADKGKFVVVYPDGTFEMNGSKGWDITTNADVEFITALIDTMADRYAIDRNKVYASGFSMGGMMSYKLICEVPERFAAIGPASGYPLFGANNCSPEVPVPVCHTHGTTDNIVPYSGLEDWMKKIVTADGCPATSTKSDVSSSVQREYWGPCDEGSEIIIYHFEGMGHGYPTSSRQQFSASDTFWTFFEKHPRSGVGVRFSGVNSREKRPEPVRYCAGYILLNGNAGPGCIRMTDARGRAVATWRTKAPDAGRRSLPVGSLPAGVYFVKASESSGNAVATILIP